MLQRCNMGNLSMTASYAEMIEAVRDEATAGPG